MTRTTAPPAVATAPVEAPAGHAPAPPVELGMLIDGAWERPAGRDPLPSVDPFTRRTWATIADASPTDVERAIAAARRAFEGPWGALSGGERARRLLALADLVDRDAERIARIESADNGKLLRETLRQVRFSARAYRYFAGHADLMTGETLPVDDPDILDYTIREPAGVAALVIAWNSPASLLSNKLAPALAAGNAVVVKPSEHASVSVLEVARLADEAGFPPGTINVVTGGPDAGMALCTLPGVDRISFTGGDATGSVIAAAAARRLTPVSLELGGKSPSIVFEDADLDRTLVGVLAGIFSGGGQTCVAGSRLLLQDTVHDAFLERLAARAGRIRLGDPLEASTQIGPLANAPHLERVLGHLADAREDGAEVVAGGGAPARGPFADGWFVEPTVLAGVDNAMRIARHEVFGPVLAVIPFHDEDEAIAIANDTEYGLASGIWTRDLARAHRVARRIRAGTVWVNTHRMAHVQAPFGGRGRSGYGRERGPHALHEYTVVKNVMVDLAASRPDPFADDR